MMAMCTTKNAQEIYKSDLQLMKIQLVNFLGMFNV